MQTKLSFLVAEAVPEVTASQKTTLMAGKLPAAMLLHNSVECVAVKIDWHKPILHSMNIESVRLFLEGH